MGSPRIKFETSLEFVLFLTFPEYFAVCSEYSIYDSLPALEIVVKVLVPCNYVGTQHSYCMYLTMEGVYEILMMLIISPSGNSKAGD